MTSIMRLKRCTAAILRSKRSLATTLNRHGESNTHTLGPEGKSAVGSGTVEYLFNCHPELEDAVAGYKAPQCQKLPKSWHRWLMGTSVPDDVRSDRFEKPLREHESGSTPIEQHVNAIADDYEFYKITDFLDESRQNRLKTVLVEEFSTKPRWTKYIPPEELGKGCARVPVDYPDEEVLILLPQYMKYEGELSNIETSKDYLWYHRPVMCWAYGAHNTIYSWTSPLLVNINNKIQALCARHNLQRPSTEILEYAHSHQFARFNQKDALVALNFNKTKYILCDKTVDRSFVMHTDRNVPHRYDLRFGNYARIWKNSPIDHKTVQQPFWIPNRMLMKTMHNLGLEDDDRLQLERHQEVWYGDPYFRADTVKQFSKPTLFTWHKQYQDCYMYSNALLVALVNILEVTWPLYVRYFARDQSPAIAGDILLQQNALRVRSEGHTGSWKNKIFGNERSKKPQSLTTNQSLQNREMLKDQVTENQRRFLQNYWFKHNKVGSEEIDGVPFADEDTIPFAHPLAQKWNLTDEIKDPRIAENNSLPFGLRKMVNQDSIYQDAAVPGTVDFWLSTMKPASRAITDTTEQFASQEHILTDPGTRPVEGQEPTPTNIYWSSFCGYTPFMARIKFFEDLKLEAKDQYNNWSPLEFQIKQMVTPDLVLEKPYLLLTPERHWDIGYWQCLFMDHQDTFIYRKKEDSQRFLEKESGVLDPLNPMDVKYVNDRRYKSKKVEYRCGLFTGDQSYSTVSSNPEGDHFDPAALSSRFSASGKLRTAQTENALAQRQLQIHEVTLKRHSLEIASNERLCFPDVELHSSTSQLQCFNDFDLEATLDAGLTPGYETDVINFSEKIPWIRAVLVEKYMNIVKEITGGNRSSTQPTFEFGFTDYANDYFTHDYDQLKSFDVNSRVGQEAVLIGPRIVDYFQTELKPEVFNSLTRVGEHIVVSEAFFNMVKTKIHFIDFLPRSHAYMDGTDSKVFTEVTNDSVEPFLGKRPPTAFKYFEKCEMGRVRGRGTWRDWPIQSSVTDLQKVFILLLRAECSKANLEMYINTNFGHQTTISRKIEDAHELKKIMDRCMVMAQAYCLSVNHFRELPLNGFELPAKIRKRCKDEFQESLPSKSKPEKKPVEFVEVTTPVAPTPTKKKASTATKKKASKPAPKKKAAKEPKAKKPRKSKKAAAKG